jgi:hypothetical protein
MLPLSALGDKQINRLGSMKKRIGRRFSLVFQRLPFQP